MKIIKKDQSMVKEKFSKIANLSAGKPIDLQNYKKSGTKVFKIDNVSYGKADWTTVKYVSENYVSENNFPIIHEDDILIALNRPITNNQLKIMLAGKFEEGSLLYQRVGRIENKSTINNYYLYKQLQKQIFKFVKKNTLGGNIPFIKNSEINKLNIFFVNDRKQQDKIASVLSQQEEQVNKIKTLIEKLEKRNQYYAERLLSGELRVREGADGEIEFYENEDWVNIKLNHYLKKEDFKMPKDWKKRLVNAETLFTKGTSINAALFNFEGKGLQFLRTGDIWEEASSSKEPAYYDGQVDDKFIKNLEDYMSVFEGYNTKIGKGTIGLVTNNLEGIVSSHLYKTENKIINGKYYSVALLKLNYIQNLILRQGIGTTVLSATKAIKTLEYIYPTDKKEKILIEKVLAGFYSEVEKLKKTVPKEQKRFDWMSDSLLSGEYQIVD